MAYRNRGNKPGKHPRRKRKGRFLAWIIMLEVLVAAAGIGILCIHMMENRVMENQSDPQEQVSLEYIEETEAEGRVPVVPAPEISEQLLTVNEWSRPGKKLRGVKYVVIHYLGNPNTTAQENHDYFESLKDLQNVSMSANYVIGIDGEIIHCVPDDEVAYASNKYNEFSLSIENCHKDETGRFTEETYQSLVKLTAYLTDQYDLDRDHIIRHYDATKTAKYEGKNCPKFFVEHEDAWERFKDEVMAYRASWEQEAQAQKKAMELEKDSELAAFLSEE
ncbi:MAG: peptidoglycan recognition family protein [Lachnospiraceae bacterium]|nr:peptidoglycan recognition family protein [Lachnospiraceae bacterium]